MLTNLFQKSKPISYVLIALALLIVYVLNLSNNLSWASDSYGVVKKIGLFIIVVSSVLLVQFINYKNKLSSQNVYALFFYTCFLILFSTYFGNTNIIIANILLLLALRRIFSMTSLANLKLKIFDATLWILLASLFHFWAICFLILLYFSIIWYCSSDYRNWLIPLVALFVVGVLFYTYCLFTDTSFLAYWQHHFSISFNFSYFENVYQNIALAIFASIAVLFAVAQVLDLRNIPLNSHIVYNKILVCFLVGASIYIVSDQKNNSYLVFTFFPLAVLGANYVERLPKKWMKETVLGSVLGISLLLFLCQVL